MSTPRRFAPWAVLIATLTALAGCQNPPPRPQTLAPGDLSYAKAYLSWMIERVRNEQDVPGVSIALVRGGEVVWAEGFGLADREREVTATAETRYRVGGVSQLVTAVAALRLEEQGAWSLDRPLNDYLPELRLNSRFEGAPPVTPRLVLSHRSGIPSERMEGQWREDPLPIGELPARLAGEYLESRPGGEVHYSNLAHTLLGGAMERHVGEPFPDLVERLVLAPVGMKGAAYSEEPPVGLHAAKGYPGEEGGEGEREYPVRDLPALGLNAGVRDLGALLALLMEDGRAEEGAVLSPAVIRRMERPDPAPHPLDFDRAAAPGWFVTTAADGTPARLEQVGVTAHFQAYAAMLPRERVGVVVLANRGASAEATVPVGREALRLMLEAGGGGPAPKEPPMLAPQPGMAADPDALVGFYDTAFGFAAVRRTAEGLVVSINGEEAELKRGEDGRYAVVTRFVGLIPLELERLGLAVATVEGRTVAVLEEEGRFIPVGERLIPGTIPEPWRDRLGEWRVVGGRGEIADWAERGRVRLSLKEGLLVVTLERDGETEESMVLTPVDDRHALIAGIGYRKGGTVRVERITEAERLHYSGLILERVAHE